MTKTVEVPLEGYYESVEQGMEEFIKELKTVIEVKPIPNRPGWHHFMLVVCLSEEVAKKKLEG